MFVIDDGVAGGDAASIGMVMIVLSLPETPDEDSSSVCLELLPMLSAEKFGKLWKKQKPWVNNIYGKK